MIAKRDPTEWMTALVLGAAMLSRKREDGDWQSMTSPLGNEYLIGGTIAETRTFRLRQVRLPDDQMGVLQVAKTPEDNASVANNAANLRVIDAGIAELEAELLHEVDIRNFIPRVVESFLSESAGGRQVNILAYTDVLDSEKTLIPIMKLVSEGKRLDPKSASWIVGKLLKVLAFAHSCGVSNGKVTAGNVLLEPIYHGLILLDWSSGSFSSGGVPQDTIDEDIAAVSDLGMLLLDGQLSIYDIPDTDQLGGREKIMFERYFERLAHGIYENARKAHEAFYEMIDGFWGRKFHKFTTLPRVKE